MLMNRLEKALMNNPVRAAFQRGFEARRFLALGGPLPEGAHVLEVGCGRGVGVEVLIERFGASRVDAFDLDPQMVKLASRRLERYGERVRSWVGDVQRIEAPGETYDAVFDFGIIHHVESWRDALREIRRVLVPGGRLYAEEALPRFAQHPVLGRLMVHPREDRFGHEDFIAGIEEAGLECVADKKLGPWFGWYIARRPNVT